MYLSLEEAAWGSRRGAGCHGPCRVWLHDGSPARDVAGRDVVGGASEPAPLTAEHIPRGAVPLVDQAPLGGFPRGVPGVHQDDRHPGERRLIGGEPSELGERPGVRVRALRLPNRYPAADPAQVLELDPAVGAFGFADDGLADHVVDVPGEPGLPAAPLAQQPLRGLGSLGLQPLAELPVAGPDGTDRLAAVGGAVGVGGQVDDAEIYPEPFSRLGAWRRLGHLDDD